MILVEPGVRQRVDGSQVCDLLTTAGRRKYFARIRAMWLRQGKKCCLCGQRLAIKDAVFEHQDGRGYNGGHRDDRMEIDGRPYNGAAHSLCNLEKGSRRIDYTGFYEVP